MPAPTILPNRRAVGAVLLLLTAGCSVQTAQSDAYLGASSGGGAAFYPAPPPAPRIPPAPAALPEAAVIPMPAATPSGARFTRTITITASPGDLIQPAAPPAHGAITIAGSGGPAPSLRYTPTPGYLGPDQFSLNLPAARQTLTISITAASP